MTFAMAVEKQLVSCDELELLHQSSPAVTVITAAALPLRTHLLLLLHYLLLIECCALD